MSEMSRAIAELIERGSWAALTSEDRAQFTLGANKIGRQPWDLFIFLIYLHERWSRKRTSTSQTMQAITDSNEQALDDAKEKKR